MNTSELATPGIMNAVRLMWDRVLNGGCADTGKAAHDLFDSLRLSREERRLLAIHGLAEFAKFAQRYERMRGRRAIAALAPSGTEWPEYLAALTSVYDDASGHPKPMLDFTVEDWGMFTERMRVLSVSYMERAHLGTEAMAMLNSYSAETTKDLPEEVLCVLAQKAREVLVEGRKDDS